MASSENNKYEKNTHHRSVCAVGAVYRNDDPEYFRAALTSVFNQYKINFDVHIVVDGPIGEELERVLKEFSPEIYLTRLSSSQGLGLALNAVFEEKIYDRYDIAIRFDADDVNYPNRFRTLVDKMVEEDLQLVGSYIHEIDGDSKIIGARKVPVKHSRINWYKNFINPFNHPATAMNVEALRKVGGYRHCYLHEDWFLWLHFLKMGFKVANIEEFLVGFRMNQGTISRRFGKEYRKHELNFYKTAIMKGLLNPFLAVPGFMARQAAKLFGKSIFQFLYRIMHVLPKSKDV
jgi:glycosyltransferase involved in cell wall biosynthesis